MLFCAALRVSCWKPSRGACAQVSKGPRRCVRLSLSHSALRRLLIISFQILAAELYFEELVCRLHAMSVDPTEALARQAIAKLSDNPLLRDSSRVQAVFCRVAILFTGSSDEARAAFVAAGGLEAVADAMSSHPSCGEVQLWGCHALSTMCYDENVQATFLERFGLGMLLRLLDRPGGTAHEVEAACNALYNLAYTSAGQKRLADEGVLRPLHVLMCTHAGEASVLTSVCKILSNLSCLSASRPLVMPLLALVAAALGAHPHCDTLHRWACVVLRRLTLDAERAQELLLREHFRLVLDAMDRFPSVLIVQLEGSYTLLAFASVSLDACERLRADAVPRLERALAAHADPRLALHANKALALFA